MNSKVNILVFRVFLFVIFVKCLVFMKVTFCFLFIFMYRIIFYSDSIVPVKLFQNLIISSNNGSQSTNFQRILGNETINVFLVACKDETSQTLVNILEVFNFNSIQWIIDAKGEEDWRQVEQVRTLVKTIYLFTSVKVIIFIITNDQNFYAEILESFKPWEVDIGDKLR